MVVYYPFKAHRRPRGHETVTQTLVAKALAQLRGCEYAGEFDESQRYPAALYFVPSDTIDSLVVADALGIRSEHDLFGGVVPFPFVAGKTITHALPNADSAAPPGWSAAFAQQVDGVVLPGFAAFSAQDARMAGTRLLQDGAVRIKKAGGVGGLGQSVVTDVQQLEQEIDSVDKDEWSRDGMVLERNLVELNTYSVGQVRVGSLLATYHGTQSLTTNNRGQQVYGGSSLTVVRGDCDALLGIVESADLRTAITQARTYHQAALRAFSGMFASRCNYDIAQGRDDQGRWCSGVLEQSWRIGGASSAELAALLAFRDDPGLNAICASTTEVYGAEPPLPSDAVVNFCGVDDHTGPIAKYTQLKPYDHA